MFSDEFSIFIAVICFVLAVVFFMGKGAGVISLFDGKSNPRRKKKSPEDERRYQRVFGIFCLIIAAGEISMILIPDDATAGIVSIVIVVGALIWAVVYLKKNFPDG